MKFIKGTGRLDWSLVAIVSVLMGIGIAMVYSATINDHVVWFKSFWFRQIIHFAAGWALVFLLLLSKPRLWFNIAYPFYALTLVLLFFVLFVGGVESHGAGRWIGFGFFRFQPSEFAKIGYLLVLSRYLAGKTVSLERPLTFVVPGLLFIVPFLLVLKQPNLSTALTFSATTLALLFWSGLRLPDLFLLLAPAFSVMAAMNRVAWGLLLASVFLVIWKRKLPALVSTVILVLTIGGGFASFMVWNSVLEEHQRSRILTFVDPMRDPKGAGYQVIQSKVTIGSGGIFGKGFGSGSQTNLAFLPEEHTDFIFSVLGEQFGLFGCSLVLFLFFLLFLRAMNICQIHGHPFINLMVVGACTIILFHVFVNIAMTLGLAPVTGLPLPFLSYGGSFVMTTMVLVGFLLMLRAKGDEI